MIGMLSARPKPITLEHIYNETVSLSAEAREIVRVFPILFHTLASSVRNAGPPPRRLSEPPRTVSLEDIYTAIVGVRADLDAVGHTMEAYMTAAMEQAAKEQAPDDASTPE